MTFTLEFIGSSDEISKLFIKNIERKRNFISQSLYIDDSSLGRHPRLYASCSLCEREFTQDRILVG